MSLGHPVSLSEWAELSRGKHSLGWLTALLSEVIMRHVGKEREFIGWHRSHQIQAKSQALISEVPSHGMMMMMGSSQSQVPAPMAAFYFFIRCLLFDVRFIFMYLIYLIVCGFAFTSFFFCLFGSLQIATRNIFLFRFLGSASSWVSRGSLVCFAR